MGPTWLRKSLLFCLNLHVQMLKKIKLYEYSNNHVKISLLFWIPKVMFPKNFNYSRFFFHFSIRFKMLWDWLLLNISLFYYGNLRIIFVYPLNSCKLIEARTQEVHWLWESVATDNFFKNYAYCGDQLFLVRLIAKAEVLAISHQLVHTATSRLHSSVK